VMVNSVNSPYFSVKKNHIFDAWLPQFFVVYNTHFSWWASPFMVKTPQKSSQAWQPRKAGTQN
jgi:hypothetical protein